jgi:DNA repair protein RadD
MRLRLRPYQGRALRAAHEHLSAGVRSVLIVAPCGAGKGVLAVRLMLGVAAKGKRACFVAPRRVIVDDAFKRLVHNGMPEEQLGMLMGDDERSNPAAPIQVASLDTLRRRQVDDFDLIVFDEAHMSLDGCIEVAKRFPRARILGLTATPVRGDGRGLGELYQEMVVVTTPSQLIAEGWLVEPEIWTVPAEQLPDVSAVPILGGDYDLQALGAASAKRALVGSIVEHWFRRAERRRTAVFAATVEHSQLVVGMFRDAGVRAEHLDAFTPQEERKAILRRVDAGETLVLSNVGVLSVGWDQPCVKVAILARLTLSESLAVQMPGRIMRPFEGVGALILDHAGIYRVHGFPHADREYSLEGGAKARRALVAPPRTCPACFAVFEAELRACPRCRLVVVAAAGKRRRGPTSVDGELVRTTGEAPKEKPVSEEKYLASLIWVARNRGLGRGFVIRKFETKFEHAIPPTLMPRLCVLDGGGR